MVLLNRETILNNYGYSCLPNTLAYKTKLYASGTKFAPPQKTWLQNLSKTQLQVSLAADLAVNFWELWVLERELMQAGWMLPVF